MSKRNLLNKTVTVIVPCYNVESYLERCLESILNQTHKEIEIILVDDYSTDGTKEIIRRYESKYSFIKAIYNKQNRRQGYCRNVAIQLVTTEYVAFVDSDDWLEPTFIQYMYEALTESSADIVVCDMFVKHDNPSADFRVKMYDPKPNRFGFINTGFAASSSNKLFKTKVLRELKYPEDIINEDISVVLPALYKHETVYTEKTYYNYYQRPGSTQNGQITSKRFDVFRAVEILKNNVGSRIDKKTWDIIIWHQIVQLFLRVLPRASGFLHRKKLIKDFVELDKEYGTNVFQNPHLKHLGMSSRSNRLYIGSLMRFIKYRQFLLASLLMGWFFFYLKHKHRLIVLKKITKVPILLVTDPRSFFRKLKATIVRKHVIKNDLTINDLIAEARRQQGLVSDNPVSVVIPNYNYEHYLIQRIYSILYQTEKIGEILILDDNSTDNSVELAQEIEEAIGNYVKIRLINNTKNQGTFRQWQKGFAKSKYDYVWIAEADDYCSPKFLTNTLRPLNTNKNIIISYADTGFIDERGLFIDSVKVHIDYQESGHWNRDYVNNGIDEVKNYSYLNNTIANVSSVVFRKKPEINYSEIFALSREYKQAGDWVFYVNYMLYGDIAYIDKPINYYRLHGNNVSSKTKAVDHLNEIIRVYAMLNKKLHLSASHKQAQKKRIKFLKKAWNI